MQPEIQNFIDQCIARNTKRNYSIILNRFKEWSNGVYPVDNLWTKDYIVFLKLLGLGNKTINLNVSVVGKFIRFSTGTKLEFDRLREERTEIEFLTDEEEAKLLDTCTPEFKIVVQFMLETGVRVGELEALSRTLRDAIPQDLVITGKGNKQRLIVISEAMVESLHAVTKDGMIFGRIWPVRVVQLELKRTGNNAGIRKNLHPHMLRHTFATKMIWGGVDITEVQKMLGHAYLNTTQGYTHVTEDRLRKVWREQHAKK